MLPAAVKELLIKHLDDGKRQHQNDVEKNLARVLPNALDRKYPNAGQEWGWQWVFPATRYYVDRETGRITGIIFTNQCYKKPCERLFATRG